MGNVIHGASHKAIRFMREAPAALAVFWIYSSRTNYENVAWPALRGLARDTGWSVNTISKARSWLVEHGALEQVKGYVRPEWRKLEPAKQKQRVNLDKSEYYRPTGKIVIDDKEYPLLYIPQSEQSDIESVDDVSPRQTSPASDIVSDDTELDTSTTKHDTKKHSAPNGAGASQPKPRKREPFYDAIADVWETDASGIIVTIRSIMQGTATRRTIKDCNFNPPVTDVEEIYAFRPFMKARMAEKKMTAPPSAYTTIQAWFYDFRKGRVKKQSAPQVVIAPEPVEEVVTPGELAARRALTQSVRPEWEREGI